MPAYNEERGIADQRGALFAIGFGSADFAFEIIVVDNASEDATAAASRRWSTASGSAAPERRNRGKGYSVRRGMLAARGELRLHCDADCAPSLRLAPERMLELIERRRRGGRLAPGRRRAASGGASRSARRIVGRTLRATSAG